VREAEVTIVVKCFASLARYQPENAEAFPITEGETVREVLGRLGIPEGEASLIFVNNVHRKRGQVLKDGDTVGFFPPIGGG
jgi:molybdopterin converting factor small subunit